MIKGIHLSSGAIEVPKDSVLKQAIPRLKTGQVMDVKVLKPLSGGNVQLLVNGEVLTAKTPLLLHPGETLSVRVMKDNDTLILKLVAPLREMNSALLSSLTGLVSEKQIYEGLDKLPVKNLKTLLYDMALKSGKPDDRILTRFLAAGGLLWEKKAASVLQSLNAGTQKQDLSLLLRQDIKGTVLQHAGLQGSGSLDMVQLLTRFSEIIEKFQLLNHQTSESGRYLLPFPVLADNTFSFGQLLVDTGDSGTKDQPGDGKVINVSLLLDMSRLGPVRADFSIYKKALSGKFRLRDPATCDYIRSLIPDLKDRLARSEYMIHQISCVVAVPGEIDSTALMESILKQDSSGILNIVI